MPGAPPHWQFGLLIECLQVPGGRVKQQQCCLASPGMLSYTDHGIWKFDKSKRDSGGKIGSEILNLILMTSISWRFRHTNTGGDATDGSMRSVQQPEVNQPPGRRSRIIQKIDSYQLPEIVYPSLARF